MNNKIESNTIEESLRNEINNYIIVKLNNGRVMSGILKESDGEYVIKLGVKLIPLDLNTITRIILV